MKSSGRTVPKRGDSPAKEQPAQTERRRSIMRIHPKLARLMVAGAMLGAAAVGGCAPSSPSPSQVPSKPNASSMQASTAATEQAATTRATSSRQATTASAASSMQASTAATEHVPTASAASSAQATTATTEQAVTVIHPSTTQTELASKALAEAQAEFDSNAAVIREHFASIIENKMKKFDTNFSFAPYAQRFNEQLNKLLVRSNVIFVYEPGSSRSGSVSKSGIITLNVANASLYTLLHEALDYISKDCDSRYRAEAFSEFCVLSSGPELLAMRASSGDQTQPVRRPFAAYPPQTLAIDFFLDSGIVKPDACFKAYLGDATEFNAQIDAFFPGRDLPKTLFPSNTSLPRNDVGYVDTLRIFLSDPRTKDIADDILARAAVLNIRVPELAEGR